MYYTVVLLPVLLQSHIPVQNSMSSRFFHVSIYHHHRKICMRCCDGGVALVCAFVETKNVHFLI